MPTYHIGDNKYEIPDDMPEADKTTYLSAKMREYEASKNGGVSPVTSDTPTAAPVEPSKTLYDIDLQHDPDYVQASKLTYAKREGKPFTGTDAEAADYGTNLMGWFNYNLPRMALDANRMRTADPEEAKSFLYLMDTYDKLGVSWNGAGRAAKGILTDFTSYIGLTTLGIGTAAGQATKVASKAAVKEALTLAVRSGVEAGVMGAAQAALEQQTRVNAGGQESIDPSKVLTGAAIGTAFGGALGGVGSMVGTALRKGATEVSQEASGLAGKVDGSLPTGKAETAAGEATVPLERAIESKGYVVDAFHGTKSTFDTFDPSKLGSNTGADSAEKGFFFAKGSETANAYAKRDLELTDMADRISGLPQDAKPEAMKLWKEIETGNERLRDPDLSDAEESYLRNEVEGKWDAFNKLMEDNEHVGGNVHPVKLKMDNPYIHDFKGEETRSVTYSDIIDKAIELGHDSVILKNTYDGGPLDDIYVVFKPDQVKSKFDADLDKAVNIKPPPTLQPETTSVLDTIKNIASDTEQMQGFPTGRQEIDIKFNTAVQQLSDMSPQEIDRFISDIRSAELRGEEMSGVKSVLKQFNDITAAKHSEALSSALSGDVKALDDLEKYQLILDRVTKADTDFSSMSGVDLSNRVGSFNTGDMRDITPTSILKEKGINPELATAEQKLKASQEYDRLYQAYLNKIEQQPRMIELTDEFNKALDEGDYGRANVIQTELDGIRKAEVDALNSSLPGKTKDAIVKGQQAIIEWMVGGALSTSSALVNTLMSGVQTVIRPITEYVGNNPISRAEFNRLSGTYGAMISQADVALKKALLAFKYEETLTGTDYSRFMEHAPVIPGKVGKVVRFFPNLLNSTDQFFAHLNYMGYINGTAAAQATEKATELGLKGSNREAFIKAEMAKAVSSAYINPGINSLFDRVRQQGIKRGLKGEKLSLFIKTELNKNADLLGEASEMQGLNYMRDTLFKREFEGNHHGTMGLSELARMYEKGMNRVPLLRALQLFFRTPVRVAEQVARLTPGINSVVLFHDLMGKNGPQRQARAYGEFFLSQAIAAKALVEYAEGKGSGSGPDDFREKRLQEQAGKKFSAQFDSEGNALGLNNLDPLFGPKKIIWSTLDRMAMIQYRKAQGEYVGEEEKAARDMLMSGFISMFVTIKDMNMLGGLQEIVKAGQVMADPKSGEDASSQFWNKKASSLIPGIISKSLNLYGADPEKTDPKTLWQFVHSRIDPADPRIPRQYDAIGKPVEVTNPVAAITGLDISSRAMRHGSDSPKEIAVKEELARIATATKSSFAMPYKLPQTQFGDIDLRENYTADGKETLYDRMQRYYRESGVTDALHEYVVKSNGGYGTVNDDGPKSIAAKTIINKFHQYAAGKLFMEEEKLMDARMKRAAGKMDAVLGKKEVFGSPYNQ